MKNQPRRLQSLPLPKGEGKQFLANGDARCIARSQQAALEQARRMRHQNVALELLGMPTAEAHQHVKKAVSIVDQWEADGVCSQDYISAWRCLLALPVESLAIEMCGDLQGWGLALRQNSPWTNSKLG